jgi:hypothetical protein
MSDNFEYRLTTDPAERKAAADRMRHVRYMRWVSNEERAATIYKWTIEQTTDQRPARVAIDKIIATLDGTDPTLCIGIRGMPNADAYLVSDFLIQCTRNQDFEEYTALIWGIREHWDRALRVKGGEAERTWIIQTPDRKATEERSRMTAFREEVARRAEARRADKEAETQ